jgi:hypothetical protein
VTLETAWLEEKGEGRVSSFVLWSMLYRLSENMTGTDKDRAENDSWSLASFCSANSVVFSAYLANYGK